ncbi:hypothetical protein J7E83_11125 [Arthrobacter sp. ISL-48]|nr:hypothetical protein [Arthrobacter sp. ISL-48]
MITKAAAPSAAASKAAQLSPGMTLAPVPPVPAAPVSQDKDGCLPSDAGNAVTHGILECQYFTSGSMMPPSLPHEPGFGAGDYAIRFSMAGGRPTMTVRVPCASYAVQVTIVDETITPVPGTMDSFVGTCTFPWDEDQKRLTQYLQAPLQFTVREDGLVLHNPEWGITLFSTPYDAP